VARRHPRHRGAVCAHLRAAVGPSSGGVLVPCVQVVGAQRGSPAPAGGLRAAHRAPGDPGARRAPGRVLGAAGGPRRGRRGSPRKGSLIGLYPFNESYRTEGKARRVTVRRAAPSRRSRGTRSRCLRLRPRGAPRGAGGAIRGGGGARGAQAAPRRAGGLGRRGARSARCYMLVYGHQRAAALQGRRACAPCAADAPARASPARVAPWCLVRGDGEGRACAAPAAELYRLYHRTRVAGYSSVISDGITAPRHYIERITRPIQHILHTVYSSTVLKCLQYSIYLMRNAVNKPATPCSSMILVLSGARRRWGRARSPFPVAAGRHHHPGRRGARRRVRGRGAQARRPCSAAAR